MENKLYGAIEAGWPVLLENIGETIDSFYVLSCKESSLNQELHIVSKLEKDNLNIMKTLDFT
jgi:hypothetical protein